MSVEWSDAKANDGRASYEGRSALTGPAISVELHWGRGGELQPDGGATPHHSIRRLGRKQDARELAACH